MATNFLRTAWRSWRKHPLSSVINMTGLTTGLACCILIALYIQNELSYDRFQEKGSRLARVIMEYKFDGSSEFKRGNFTSVRVATVFKRTFPEVEDAIRMTPAQRVVSYGEKMFSEKRFVYADPSFFRMFSFHLLQGDTATALSAIGNIVLTESSARKYFGDENPMGKTLRIGDTVFYKVTGVLRDLPVNSQIKADFVAPFAALRLPKEWDATYWDANYTTYLLLHNEQSIASLQSKIPAFMKKDMKEPGASINFILEPFTSIHLHSPYAGFEPNNSITYIYILSIVALLILVIVCSTFINLSTAQSMDRAREVGVRKVMGAEKKQLFWQFIAESFLFCLAALILSMLISALALPAFEQLSGKEFHAGQLFSWQMALFCVSVLTVMSLLAGSYPALVLSNFQPIRVLKGAFKNTSSGKGLRTSLIVFQFTISVFLIITTIVVQKQLYFIQHKDLGYDREHVLVLPMYSKMLPMLPTIKQEFKRDHDVLSVASCVRNPTEGGGGYNMRSEIMPSTAQIGVTANPVDQDFLQTMRIELLSGNNITEQDIRDASKDSGNVYHFILNESAAHELGWSPKQAVGKKMFLGDNRPGFVSGVVRDFFFSSLHNPVTSMVLFPESYRSELLVRLSGSNLQQTIAALEAKWKALVPGRPFEYRFMDEDYDKLYQSEIRLGQIMKIFSSMAIFLACLGLFGLSAYAAHQRLKEISVRKVLGASLDNLILVLSADFIKLALVANVIAFPLAWWAMSKWLEDFAYKTTMGWGVYALATLVTLSLAMLTVSYHAVRAAFANPVNSLRTE